MKVRWTETALTDLETIHAYIAQDKPDAAMKPVKRIFEAAEALSLYPNIGRPGRDPATRELVLPPYFIAYRTDAETVYIQAVLHSSRSYE